MNTQELKSFFNEVVESSLPLKDIMERRRLYYKKRYLKQKLLKAKSNLSN